MRPLLSTTRPRARRTAAALAILIGLGTAPARAAGAVPVLAGATAAVGVIETPVDFTGDGGVHLSGSIIEPAHLTGRHPAMVLVGGATNAAHGPKHTRDDQRAQAQAYAAHGIVTLIYDKRSIGYTVFHRDYGQLATDALAALQVLRSRPEVDLARTGLWGLSEGGWVVSIAASRSRDVKFLVTVGASGLTPSRQTAWADDQPLVHAEVSRSLRDAVHSGLRLVVSAGMFPEADFDPVPVWQSLHQPVLLTWGAQDRQAVPAESAQIIRRALDTGGNAHYTELFLPGTHDLFVPADDGFSHAIRLIPANSDLVANWVNGLTVGPLAALARPAPHQLSASRPLGSTIPWLQLAAIALLMILFAAYPVTALVRRIAGRRGAPPAAGPARLLAATGLVTMLGVPAYLFFILITASNVLGPIVVGRTLPWLVLQAAAIAMAAATAATALSWWRSHAATPRSAASTTTGTATGPQREGANVRLLLLLATGVLATTWALYWHVLWP
jgi:uncharacterized protein